MGGKVTLCHQGQLKCSQRGGDDVPGNGLAQHFLGNAVRLGDSQGFAQTLHHSGGDHVGDQFDDGAGSDAAQVQDVPGTVLQHGAYAVQCGGIRANVVNQFPFFRGQTGAGERAIHIRAADGGTHQGEFADGRQVNG